jgi:hypothetical protein
VFRKPLEKAYAGTYSKETYTIVKTIDWKTPPAYKLVNRATLAPVKIIKKQPEVNLNDF